MELTIENLIKIILGLIVAVAVIAAVGFLFKDYVLEFFRTGDKTKDVLFLLK